MAETGQALMVGIASIVGGAIVVGLSKKIADAVVGDADKLEEEKYELMHQRLAQRQFYIPPPGNSTTFETAGSSDSRRQSVPASVTGPMEYVRGALQNLEDAKGTTKCGVCQKELAESIKLLKSKTAVIERADMKYKFLQDLKSAGKIPEGATWYSLKPKQKEFINRKVEEAMIS
jgi:Mg2+ and Co2+ transporter CorA